MEEEAAHHDIAAGDAHETRYAAFLLRVWRNEARDDWRLVIEEVGTEARQGFTDWDELARYLRTHVAEESARDT
jgi:hypothetical protein